MSGASADDQRRDDQEQWINPKVLRGWTTSQPERWINPKVMQTWVPPEPLVLAGESIRVAARFTTGAVIATTVLRLCYAVHLFGEGDTATLAQSTVDTDRLLVLMIGMIALGTGVSFIVWLYLAYANVQRWGIRGLSWSKGWAIGAWFIPLANLVIPKGVVDAVYSASVAPAGQTEVRSQSSPLIWSWWLTFVGGNIVSGCTSGAVRNRGIASLVGASILSVTAVLCVLVIRMVTEAQEQRIAALTSRH